VEDSIAPEGSPTEALEAARPTRRRLRRALIVAGIVAGTLAVVGALLYSFGTMQPPSAAVRAAYDTEVAAGRAPGVEARFGIPVPGCVCHADDPVLQVQHSTRRISECFTCHVRG
jgi:hypothetical protein